jgi:hypothetical protein
MRRNCVSWLVVGDDDDDEITSISQQGNCEVRGRASQAAALTPSHHVEEWDSVWLPYPRLNAGNLGWYSRKQTSSGLIGRNKTIHDLFGRKGQALLKLATSQ